MVRGQLSTDGLEVPAVTICGRHPQFKRGWKEYVTSGYDGILENMCGETDNIEGCIERKTFAQTEVIKDTTMGYVLQKSLTNTTNPWIEDFTRSVEGRCYTLNITERIGPDGKTDRLFFLLGYQMTYRIFIHDPNYFVINTNPLALPTIMMKLNPNKSSSHFYRLALTYVEELNGSEDPCDSDPSYNFQTCVR